MLCKARSRHAGTFPGRWFSACLPARLPTCLPACLLAYWLDRLPSLISRMVADVLLPSARCNTRRMQVGSCVPPRWKLGSDSHSTHHHHHHPLVLCGFQTTSVVAWVQRATSFRQPCRRTGSGSGHYIVVLLLYAIGERSLWPSSSYAGRDLFPGSNAEPKVPPR